MSEHEPPHIALVVEAPADAETAKALIDRVMCEVDWIEPETLPHLRRFEGDPPHPKVLLWKQVKQLCSEHGVRAQGHFDGKPGAADAHAARRALLLLRRLGQPEAVVLMRDADNQPERQAGLTQARDHGRHRMQPERIAIGVAVPEREAWHLCGFDAESDDERRRSVSERGRLGFDPTERAHELRGDGKRSAKTALDNLTGKDRERERRCLDAPLQQLRKRGHGCGLTEFLDEVETRVVPVVRERD